MILIGFSSGTNSIFFFFFLFAILVASFRFGFPSGLWVTLVSAFCFTTVGFATTPFESVFEFNRFLLRPVFLLVLGYMMAYWGGAEITSKRRLAFLQEISTLSNPRFGVERMLGALIQRLRAFYDADVCLLVTAEPIAGQYRMRCIKRHNTITVEQAETIPQEIAQIFLGLPTEQVLLYRSLPRFWKWQHASMVAFPSLRASADKKTVLTQMADLLAVDTFITVPFCFRGMSDGRLYLASQGYGTFESADIDFLAQVVEYIVPVLDNLQLVDRLASDAAEIERQRIVHDFHDSVIQPYIGLHMGLSALRHKLQADADVSVDIEQLIRLSNVGIADLRHYMEGLRQGSAEKRGLLPAVQQFGQRFTEATGIAVHIETRGEMHINDRLAAEVCQMVAEGLSNIRRHTHSMQARIALEGHGSHLVLQIANDTEPGASRVPFTPRSLTERAEALGGRVHVEWLQPRTTVVLIDIPL